jgi:predicted dienelactone hydrolase
MYDPFSAGPFGVATREFELRDEARGRVFPCEVWRPEGAGEGSPLVVYSHPALFHRRAALYLCTHLASHGYTVAAMDHSEVVVPELGRRAEETREERAARFDGIIGSRVPDVRLLLEAFPAAAPVGVVGHSLGGWTALAAPDVEPRVEAVVALAPGGASERKPGILPLTLDFRWPREVPALVIAADGDTALPLSGMYEIYERIPGTKQMAVLARADHAHFLDHPERQHEAIRTAPLPPELAGMQKEMRPISELCSGEEAHRFTRGLTLCHFDAFLREVGLAREMWDGLGVTAKL